MTGQDSRTVSDRIDSVKDLVEYGAAKTAAHAADTLAAYLELKRPDLEESIASIRGWGDAIRQSITFVSDDGSD